MFVFMNFIFNTISIVYVDFIDSVSIPLCVFLLVFFFSKLVAFIV